MLDQKYRVRVSREPMIAGERQQARSKKLLMYGLIGGGVVVIVLVALVVLGTRGKSAPANNTASTAATELTLGVDKGTVQTKEGDAADFMAAKDGGVVAAGTTVRTDAASSASLELSTGSLVRLNENSRLDVVTVSSDKLEVRLVGGEAWSTIAGSTKRTPITLSTLEARVTAAASSFDVVHGKDQTTVYAVTDAASVTATKITDTTADLGSTTLKEGTQTTVAAKNLPASESDFDTKDIASATSDAFWFRYNAELDASFADKVAGRPDTTKPILKVTSPKDNLETTESSLQVKGTTDVSATVQVNDKDVDNKLGAFSTSVTLKEGDNTITVTSTDAANNQAKQTLTVTRKKGKPAAVSLSLASEVAGTITLGWSKSEIDNFASYKIKRGGSVIKTITDATTISYKDTGLTEGTEYTYSVCVVDDSDQETCSTEKSLTPKSSPNKPPTVSITSPVSGVSITGGTSTSFVASGSDPEGGELTYTWDFGDGATTAGASVSHTYAVVTTAQTFYVKVTVKDRAGATAEATVTVTVAP